MRRSLLLTVLSFAWLISWTQDEPTSAPKINAFSVSPDNLGAISNSVNLFTGDLNLPVSLVAMPGKGGLNIDVSIAYNSNVQSIVGIWNLEAPTSVIGLGWSIPRSQIIVDNKATGTREDDEFYLVENGSTTRLICVGSDISYKAYKTKTFHNWIVKYFKSSEKWEITKEDGSTFIYGDQSSGRNTVQWCVKWGNWMGASSLTSGQQRQGLVWDISEIRNLWGDKIQFTYLVTEQRVGVNGLYHTEASYLASIGDSWGNAVDFTYGNKTTNEFMEPHIEKASEPDAYEERYETKYLDKLAIRNEGVNQSEIRFQYGFLNTGNLTKRVLSSITKVNEIGESQRVMSFSYSSSGPVKGSMTRVTTALGASVDFIYNTIGTVVSRSSRELTIQAPSGGNGYAEPKVWLGSDYTVVTWRELNSSGGHATGSSGKNMKVQAYTWDGRWIADEDISDIPDVTMTTDYVQGYQLAIGRDFFAIKKPTHTGDNYLIQLHHKDEKVPGNWIVNSYTIDLKDHNTDRDNIFAGDNYVAVTSNARVLFTFVWNGVSWIQQETNRREDFGLNTNTYNRDQAHGFGHNFIINHEYNTDPDFLQVMYLDEEKNWRTVNQTVTYNSERDGNAEWFGSNAMAFTFRHGGNEYIFRWDENYNFQNPWSIGAAMSHQSYVYTSNAIVSVAEPSSPSSIRCYRFDGSSWIETSQTSSWIGDVSFADDVIYWKNGLNKIRSFDPNSNTWGAIAEFPDYDGFQFASNSAYFDLAKAHIRTNSGIWTQYSTFGFSQGAPNVIYAADKYYLSEYPSSYSSYYAIGYVKNGATNNTSGYFDDTKSARATRGAMASPNSFVVAPNGFHIDRTTLTLHRIVDYEHRNSLIDYPIYRVQVIDDDGNNQQTYIDYDASKAVFDASGTVCRYNKVTVINGSSALSNRSYGYTEHYFFNGLSPADMGENFSGDMAAKYGLFLGSPYKTVVKNSANAVVSTTESIYESIVEPIRNSLLTAIEVSQVIRLKQSKSFGDGVQYVSDYNYNSPALGGQLLSQEVYTTSPSGTSDKIRTEFYYWWQQYDSNREKNILTPIIATKSLVNNVVISAQVTRYKDWAAVNSQLGIVPGPYDSYVWRGFGSYTFSDWESSVTPNPSVWEFSNRIEARDNASGAVLQARGRGDYISSNLLDERKCRILAQVVNAQQADIAFSSFEDNSAGNFTSIEGTRIEGDSKTGKYCYKLGLTGVSKSLLNTNTTHTVSFWAKSSGGTVYVSGIGNIIVNSPNQWTLYEFEIPKLQSLTIKRVGTIEVMIDELRFHPVMAEMNTYTHHPLFGTTSQTDANNQSTYTQYDSFGRPIGLFNDDRELVKSYRYHFKQ